MRSEFKTFNNNKKLQYVSKNNVTNFFPIVSYPILSYVSNICVLKISSKSISKGGFSCYKSVAFLITISYKHYFSNFIICNFVIQQNKYISILTNSSIFSLKENKTTSIICNNIGYLIGFKKVYTVLFFRWHFITNEPILTNLVSFLVKST